jgi:hypothetical protein
MIKVSPARHMTTNSLLTWQYALLLLCSHLSQLTSRLPYVSDHANSSLEVAQRLALRRTQQAVHEIVRELGGRSITRPMFRNRPDLGMTFIDVEPVAGLRVAAQLKRAAHLVGLDYVRCAREDGHTWQEIGVALGIENGTDPSISAATIAYDYAVANTTLGQPSFAWTCPACLGTVLDHGPEAGHPTDCEPGHTENCSRLAAQVAAWDAFWEEDRR